MWELAANWHGKKTHTKKTHTQEIYTKQQQKMCILGLFTMAKEGGGNRAVGGGGGWGGGRITDYFLENLFVLVM